MKLDTRALRYLTSDDWRVLAAVEQGSKNHELVPTPLITQIAGLRSGGGVQKCISSLAKAGLIAKVKNAKYDGYRLTYGGLDYLALNTHRRSNTIYSLGNQIGVGKESDIYITAAPPNHLHQETTSSGRQQILKLHRLGRISFRSVKANRDYLRHRTTGSWMYLSRLAAQKEFAVMKVLWREGFAVPEPIAWSRHTVVMEFVDAFPLRMVEHVPDEMVGGLYAELMGMIVGLARRGLIHGDFNEFNILVKEEEQARARARQHRSDERDALDENTGAEESTIALKPILIDFPQTISTNHANAQMYFDRDVRCIKRYFERRFKYVSDAPEPFFGDAAREIDAETRLDVEVEASGFSKKMARELERYVEAVGREAEEDGEGEVEEFEDEDELQTEELGDDFGEVPGGLQVDDPQLAEQLASLTTNDDFAVRPPYLKDYGLVPLELQNDHDAIAEKVHAKKKAAGWAI